jgi:hypothetical protein
MQRLLKYSFLFLTVLFLNACKKPPGEGGQASIRGTVWTEDWNSGFTVMNGQYAAADVDVYIIYGDEAGYSDRTRANYNGEYEFRYLRKGKYKIYVYSKDKTLQSPSGEVAVVKEVEITSKKEILNVEQITIYE